MFCLVISYYITPATKKSFRLLASKMWAQTDIIVNVRPTQFFMSLQTTWDQSITLTHITLIRIQVLVVMNCGSKHQILHPRPTWITHKINVLTTKSTLKIIIMSKILTETKILTYFYYRSYVCVMTLYFCRWSPMVWKNLLPPSSG